MRRWSIFINEKYGKNLEGRKNAGNLSLIRRWQPSLFICSSRVPNFTQYVLFSIFSLQLSKTLISHGDHVAESRNKRDLKRVLYEICDNVLRGSLKADQVLPSLAELAVSNNCVL